jgi:hypothetical protein
MRNRKRRSPWRGWLIGIAVLIPVLWIGYWFAAQEVARAALDRVTLRPVAGGRFACAGQSLGGFPLRLDFGCTRAAFGDGPQGTGERLSAALGGVSASAPLYLPGTIEATLESPFVVNAPPFGIAVTTQWSDATTSATAGLGGLKSAAATFHSLDFSSASGPILPVKALTADLASASAAPAGGNAYHFSATAQALKVVRADGREIPAIDGEASVTALDFGSSLGTDPRAALHAWIKAGGAARIDRLRFHAGDATADADGQLAIAPDGLLSGKLTLRLINPDAFVALAEAIKPGATKEADKILGVVMALTVPVDTPAGPARQTTLIIRNGLIFVGFIPTGIVLPAVRF